MAVLGLDIGGVNTKGCLLHENGAVGASVYHEMWRDPDGLKAVLTRLRARLDDGRAPEAVAVTMTAELCDVFSSKAQGVLCVLEQTEAAFYGLPVYVWTIDGRFVSPARVRENPLAAAASNWLAAAQMLAWRMKGRKQVLLVDMGSTTTDILPVAPGAVPVRGRTDTERLVSGELVYTGALRTPLNAIASSVYLDGCACRAANEYFAISADVYRYLGYISEDEYYVPAPDSGGRTPQDCAKRISRLAAAEAGALSEEKTRLLAEYIMEKQVQQIMDGVWQVCSRADVRAKDMVITGEGSFLLKRVAARLNRRAVPLRGLVPEAGDDTALTAFAAAWLLRRSMQTEVV